MEKELNIAAILKDKPEETKLWSPMFGECEVRHINDDIDNSISVVSTYSLNSYEFIKDGRFSEKGEMCLFPSKEMQDWSKFAWKKGDVLICSDILVIFEKWTTDDYMEFKASHEFNSHSDSFDKGNDYYTSEFCKAIDDVADNFIKKVEEHYGGKLNLSTLQIEQPKPEFKDGDIIAMTYQRRTDIAILAEYCAKYINVHAVFTNEKSLFLNKPCRENNVNLRLATDSEKQQLFDALAKEGKVWNPDTLQIEDLPKKCEFKAFDKVLIKDHNNDRWEIDFFAYYDEANQSYITTSGNSWNFCIPYNDSTKHLLGTTDEWKGGEV